MKYLSPEYRAYLHSPEWQARRHATLKAAGLKCQMCGTPAFGSGLDVHHRTYQNLGCEPLSDLVALCRPCHERADIERRQQIAMWQQDRRLNRWARKYLGEEWELFADRAWLEAMYAAWQASAWLLEDLW